MIIISINGATFITQNGDFQLDHAFIIPDVYSVQRKAKVDLLVTSYFNKTDTYVLTRCGRPLQGAGWYVTADYDTIELDNYSYHRIKTMPHTKESIENWVACGGLKKIGKYYPYLTDMSS